MDYEKIGNFIFECRKEKKLTQKQLATLIGVTDKAVSKWERGLGCPDVSILGELANSLDIGIGELLNGQKNDNLKDNNEFIKQAVLFSKTTTENSIYKKILYAIISIMFFLTIYLIVLNIIQISYLNHHTTSYFFNSDIKEIKEKYNTIKNNVEKVKLLDENLFEVENSSIDYKKNIVEWSENYLKAIDNSNILNYSGIFKISRLDAINIKGHLQNYISAPSLLLYVLEYGMNYENELLPIIKNIQILRREEQFLDLNYELNNRYYDSKLYYYGLENYDNFSFDTMIHNLSYSMEIYNQCLELILKEGGINE